MRSSLAAVYLESATSKRAPADVAIVGGVDAIQNPFSFLCFSKTQALSPNGRCRTFDAQGDGIAISEGFAAIVMKRLDDAERDGNRIYAVIRGVGGASDGRDRGLTAPRPEGQIRGVAPSLRPGGILPRHSWADWSARYRDRCRRPGRGAVALDILWRGRRSSPGLALGSVKSMIGHTKAAAGVAGLVKVALALHHRVLPATLGVTQPNPNGTSRRVHSTSTLRRVLGFKVKARHPGGRGSARLASAAPTFTWWLKNIPGRFCRTSIPWSTRCPLSCSSGTGESRTEVLEAVTGLLDKLEQGIDPGSSTSPRQSPLKPSRRNPGQPTLAFVANSVEDLVERLRRSRPSCAKEWDGSICRGESITPEEPLAREGRVAFLFPGQGSQYVNMGRDVVLAFPEARACFDRADSVLSERLDQPLSRYVFPPPSSGPRGGAAKRVVVAGNLCCAACRWGRSSLRFSRCCVTRSEAGHGGGAQLRRVRRTLQAGCYGDDVLLQLSEAHGRFIREGTAGESGTMAAVEASADDLCSLLADSEITLANLNAPRQTVLSGPRAAIERAVAWCEARGFNAQAIPVACAFHSPLVAPAQRRLAALLSEVVFAPPPQFPVFSNTTAARYPDDPSAVAAILGEHLVRPVEFVREVEAMYEAGAHVFVEVGPRAVLTGLVGRILATAPTSARRLTSPGVPGLATLLDGLRRSPPRGSRFGQAPVHGSLGAVGLTSPGLLKRRDSLGIQQPRGLSMAVGRGPPTRRTVRLRRARASPGPGD